MSKPKEFNVHRINDMIMSDSTLTSAEKIVAYFTLHRARKNGEFWWGARAVANKLQVSRNTITKTWRQMEERGWISDNQRDHGRAKSWKVEFQEMWNCSQQLRHNFAQDSEVVRGWLYPEPQVALYRAADSPSESTNSPKELAPKNSPKDTPDTFSQAEKAPEGFGEMDEDSQSLSENASQSNQGQKRMSPFVNRSSARNRDRAERLDRANRSRSMGRETRSRTGRGGPP